MTDTLTATLRTSQGQIVLRLLPDHAPKTVRNFVELAEGGRQWTDPRTGQATTGKLYDGTVFHRVIPNFMIQGGDPLGTGRGGPGYKFGDEIHPDLRFDRPYPGDEVHGHVDRHQRPGDGGPGARSRNPAAERGPGRAAAPRALAHAFHALLAHRGRAHAVGARVALAPDTGDVGLPAGMAVAGGDFLRFRVA